MYLSNLDKIKKGDILLTKESAKRSIAIRVFTISSFSHAALIVGDGSYIHADSKGVHAENLQRWLFKNKDDLQVLRYTGEGSILDDVCDYVRSLVGTEYSKTEAMKAPLSSIKYVNSNKQFCSRLVAKAYEKSGISLVKNSDFCLPDEIGKSSKLIEIQECLKIATPQEIEFAQSESPLDEQKETINSILSQIRLLTNNDIQSFSQISAFLIEFPQFDQGVTSIVKESGYLEFWKRDLTNNPWRYREDFFVKNFEVSELKNAANQEYIAANSMKSRFIENLRVYEDYYRQNNLAYFRQSIILERTLISWCEQRIAVVKGFL